VNFTSEAELAEQYFGFPGPYLGAIEAEVAEQYFGFPGPYLGAIEAEVAELVRLSGATKVVAKSEFY